MASTVVGVDVGATSVRGVEVQSGRTLSASRAATVPLPVGAVVDGAVVDSGAVADALRTLWKEGKFSTRKAALVLGGTPKVLVRPATVPYQRDKKLMGLVVRAEANKVLPVDLEGRHVDFHVLGTRKTTNPEGQAMEMADVMVVAAEKAPVDNLVAAAQDAKVRPVSVDLTPFALIRLLARVSANDGSLEVILHVGADTVQLIGVTDGQPAFMQSLNDYAGSRVTATIEENFGLSTQDAERIKKETSERIGTADDGDVHTVINTWVTALVQAARQQITSTAQRANRPVGRVWLSGGGARIGGLATRLGAELEAQVSVIDPGTWVTKADRLRAASEDGQDLTVALAAGSR